jgi:hypothetical protein
VDEQFGQLSFSVVKLFGLFEESLHLLDEGRMRTKSVALAFIPSPKPRIVSPKVCPTGTDQT